MFVLTELKSDWENLLPLSYTRSVAQFRIGRWTIKERWERALSAEVQLNSQEFLPGVSKTFDAEATHIRANALPHSALVTEIRKLQIGEAVFCNGDWIAYKGHFNDIPQLEVDRAAKEVVDTLLIQHPYHIFQFADQIVRQDFEQDLPNSQDPDSTNICFGKDIMIAESANVRGCTLNAETGPIIIDENATVMEGSNIRGPFYLGPHSTIKMGAKIYGASSFGPHSKVGGEVNNSVILGYSNKAHDGFLGNSVLGEFCNLGADTNNSNLKNNYAEVKLWNYPQGGFKRTGLQFCGLIMGDHSKSAINTMFNTGTVVGVCSNIFGDGFPRNFVPSFSWGGASGFQEYKLSKAIEVAEIVMQRRNIPMGEETKTLFRNVFDMSAKYRENY